MGFRHVEKAAKPLFLTLQHGFAAGQVLLFQLGRYPQLYHRLQKLEAKEAVQTDAATHFSSCTLR